MNYYKLINGENFVGVATTLDMRVFQHKHNILLACDESIGQYIQFNETLYHDNWMNPIDTDRIKYENVEVISIDKGEYDILYEAIEKGEEITPEPQKPDIEEQPIEPEKEITLEYMKESKTAEMSATCNKVITNGLDVILSDGKSYHFSLTTQDQLNLITLSGMVSSGEQMIPYHADGELCKFYSAEDIGTIVEAATAFKTFQVSYYNSLKSYIDTLETIEDVAAITYGIDIPFEHQSDVLKVLLQQANKESD